MSDVWKLSAIELAAGIRSGKLSSREVMETTIAQVERLDTQMNAFACIDRSAALAAADAADQARRDGHQPLGPLHGVPVSVKDLINTAGMRTAHGSFAFENNVPSEDAEAVARVRRAGGIVFGKTTTPELGCKILTDSPLHGVTRNPWDPSRTPGGSSGGAAVAVALGMGPLALTTDGAGSSRIPAACCGIVGLKPTLGSVPMELAADLFGGLSCIGVMARSTEDVALLYDVIRGPTPRDPWALGASDTRPSTPQPEPFRGLRIRWIRRMGNPGLEPAIDQLVSNAVDAMKSLDASVIHGPEDFDWSLDTCRLLLRANQATRNSHLLTERRDLLDPVLVAGLEEGLAMSSEQMRSAARERTALFRRVQHLFDDADVLVTPCFSATPPSVTHKANQGLSVNGAPALPLRDSWYTYTVPFNVTGHPAISIPCGFADDGMPVGLQMIGRWHAEHRLLHLATALQPLLGWRSPWPPIAEPLS